MPAPRQHEIETFTGKFVDIETPRAETIDIEDIAHGLSQTCRYGGQSTEYYSVAQHALFVSEYLEQQGADLRTQLAGLHHDDAEAYLGDIPRPMKKLLDPQYRSLTEAMDCVIVVALAFGGGRFAWTELDYDWPAVKAADNYALFTEARAGLVPSRGEGWAGQANNWDLGTETAERESELPEFWRASMQPRLAKVLWLDRHHDLIVARHKELTSASS